MGDDEMKMVYDIQLSDRELYTIGMVVAQWGSMEHEVFIQTLFSFETTDEDAQPEELPKAMNNAQFSKVLDLWSERVVEVSDGERRDVLRKQVASIKELAPYRHALVHGMWDYDKASLDVIKAIRVRDKQIITHEFTTDDLHYFSTRLGVINFRIRYPMGVEDLAAAHMKAGGYLSRAAAAMFSGHPIADELMPEFFREKMDALKGDKAGDG